jgi:hypothetical protein
MNTRASSMDSGILPAQRSVRLLIVGGLTRLDSFYCDAPPGLEIDAVYVDCPSLEARAEAADAVILVVGNVSHSAADKVRSVARRRGTPLVSASGPSVSRVRAAAAIACAAVLDGDAPPLEHTRRLARA